jgi:hypothetical protein
MSFISRKIFNSSRGDISWQANNEFSYFLTGGGYGQDQIAYGNGRFVATFNGIAYSDNGINWNVLPNIGFSIELVAFGNGRFVGVSNGYIAYSNNGINWNVVQIPIIDGFWMGLTYGNGRFVAIGTTNNNLGKVMYSDDGVNWIQSTIIYSNFRGIAYGNGRFVAVGSDANFYTYSNDGIIWSKGNYSANDNPDHITYGNGRFVAISRETIFGDVTSSAYSNDGITWVNSSIPNQRWNSIKYGDGKFVAISIFPSVISAYSNDGITWRLINLPQSITGEAQKSSLIYANNSFFSFFNLRIGPNSLMPASAYTL